LVQHAGQQTAAGERRGCKTVLLLLPLLLAVLLPVRIPSLTMKAGCFQVGLTAGP
jgi:hypothetical protein